MKTGVFAGCAVLVLMILARPAQLATAQQAPSPQAGDRIQKEVRHQLLMLPRLNVFDNLTYSVEGYNVTLGGEVTQPVLKSDAEAAVKSIEGVENVTNDIEVLPVSPADDRLRLQVFRAVYGYAPLQRYALPVVKPIRIIVKNGHVTLEGVVDSQSDKNTVTLRAKSVSGVFSVTNNLAVQR